MQNDVLMCTQLTYKEREALALWTIMPREQGRELWILAMTKVVWRRDGGIDDNACTVYTFSAGLNTHGQKSAFNKIIKWLSVF